MVLMHPFVGLDCMHGRGRARGLLLLSAVAAACCAPNALGFAPLGTAPGDPLARFACRGRCAAALRGCRPTMIIDRVSPAAPALFACMRGRCGRVHMRRS